MEKTQCLTNIVTSFYNNHYVYIKKYNKDQLLYIPYLYMRDIHPHSITVHITQKDKVRKDESHISKSRKIHLLLLLL